MPYKKGESGNKLGMSKAKHLKQKQIKELLLKYVPDAVDALGKMLKDPDHQPFAVKEVLDRVYGKAAQSIELGEDASTALTAVIRTLVKASDG